MRESDVIRYLDNRQNEIDSAAQYHELAKAESSAQIAEVYKRLAKEEEAHINFWERQLKQNGISFPKRKPSWRAQTLIMLAKFFGPQFILTTISEREHADQNVYAAQRESKNTKMTAQEHWHTKLLNEIERLPVKGLLGPGLAKIEGRHKFIGGNALRASVLGANDGLCSNLSLVMGVAGAAVQSHTLLITGLAGLMAGACSMALGEWVSVTSARELAKREISIEEDEFDLHPEGEAEELKLIYEAKGMSPKEATDLALHMISNKAQAMDELTREELGINPDDLGGSAIEAAAFSFALFALGALVPVLPFFFLSGSSSIIASLILSALALFLFGALTTLFTGRPVLIVGSRQMALGLGSAGLTFTLGHFLGVALT